MSVVKPLEICAS